MNSIYKELGLKTEDSNKNFYLDSSPSFLIKQSIKNKQGTLTKDGSLVVKTGKHTGRSAKDKYVVKSASTEEKIWWENTLTPMNAEQFQSLKSDVLDYINKFDEVYITERSVGADEVHNMGVRTITTHPSHALFTQHLFREKVGELKNEDFTIFHAPEFLATVGKYGNHGEAIVTTCFDTKTTIIVGTLYAGEIKKSMFSVMNYLLPDAKILPMHSGCNRLENGEVSVFFGLSGTGKTTLSTDEGTYLIGDDEHGMSDQGVFNFEGGCYAKTYKLSKKTEPEIFEVSNRFGAILENVVVDDQSGVPDFFDKTLAENGRSSYPLSFIDELETTSRGDVPKHIFFLCADAFGVLPPVTKLTREQAMFYFVLGYTAKLAGTEIGVKEPQATFSCLFGAPFMLRHPKIYAELLGHYLDKHNIKVWLINTGWTAGGYGVGERFPLSITRKIIRTIQANKLNDVATEKDPIFGLHIPCEVDDIPASILNPQQSWDDDNAYITSAQSLAKSFHTQMKSFGDFYDKNKAGAPTYNG